MERGQRPSMGPALELGRIEADDRQLGTAIGEIARGCGRFAVVASEVKKLASDSRNATERITRTIERLNQEAKGISDEIDAGVASGGEARARTAELALVLGETLAFVNALDTQSGNIAEGS